MRSSVLLLVNANVSGSEFLLHGKIFEYLASGKPILTLGAVEGKAAQIIRSANAGAAFDYDDADGIADFLSRQYQNQVDGILPNPDRDVVRQFSRKQLTNMLAEVIRQINQ